MPPNYRQQQGRPLSLHERKGAVTLAGVTLICALGIGGWEMTSGFGTSHQQNCVSVVVGSATGGGSVRACGSHARSWCKTESTSPSPLGAEIQKACRKAGYSA